MHHRHAMFRVSNGNAYDCIVLHIAATTSHVSLGRAHGGKSPRKIGGKRAITGWELENRLSSTWIGSGAEKEFPARTRCARMRLCPLCSYLALSPYGNREIHTRSFAGNVYLLFTKLLQLANFLRNIHIFC